MLAVLQKKQMGTPSCIDVEIKKRQAVAMKG